jgi:FkbM family methyltransferase
MFVFKYEQAQHWGSMSTVSFKIRSNTNQTLFIVFTRMWYTKIICNAACNPDRSYIYVEALTSNYRRTAFNLSNKNGETFKLPSVLPVIQPELKALCLGPEDPRIVLTEDNELIFTFNMLDLDRRRKIWIYNMSTGHQTALSIRNSPIMDTEKNWTPLMKNKKLHFIYSYNPLKILKCPTESGTCELIEIIQASSSSSFLRGGTQLVRFRGTEYFVGIARTKVSCRTCGSFYRPHIVVLSTKLEKFRVIYVSEPLLLDDMPIFASHSTLSNINSSDFCHGNIRIMTPGSIIDWERASDKLSFTISISDKKIYVVSIVGVGKIVRSIVSAVENSFSQILSNPILGLRMIDNSETEALAYCEAVTQPNRLHTENILTEEQNVKKKLIQAVINSPTYPTFLVASNTNSETIKLWMESDYVNFGIIGRYLMEYESSSGIPSKGTNVMIDAGGNHGTYGLYAASLNQSVHIFEVLPDYVHLIQESIRLNVNIGKMISLHPSGVSDVYGVLKVLPQEGLTRLEFVESETLEKHTREIVQNQALTILQRDVKLTKVYALDDFIFRKVSLMKVDVEGFEIRALKGATRAIGVFGVGAILIEIASNRWHRNNITVDEGISVLEHVTSIGHYVPHIIARNDVECPVSKISEINNLVEVKNLSMIDMQKGSLRFAPQIYLINEWSTIILPMTRNDWSCNFWLEKNPKDTQ